LKLNAAVVKELMDILSDGGILMRLEGDEGGYVPTTPEDKITVDEVSEIILGKSVAHRNFQRQFFPAAGYRPGSPSHERASLWRRSSLQRGSELRAERDDEFGEAA
jgi:DNA-binding IscR family transcriptional regulator